MSEKCVYLLVLSGISLRNFHHCTKRRKMQIFGQKDVAKGCGNWFRLVIEDEDSTKCNVFHASDSIITHWLPNTIICPCRGCAARCQRSEMHKSRGSRGMLLPMVFLCYLWFVKTN